MSSSPLPAVTTPQETVQAIRDIEVRLREYLTNGAKHLERLHRDVCALLPADNSDLPTIEEVSGLLAAPVRAPHPQEHP